MPENLLSVAYISSGCNRSAKVMDWGACDLICFGACHSVAVYDPKVGKILLTLSGHKGDVTCVRWIQGRKNELVSGASDSSLILWSLEETEYCFKKTVSSLSGHESSILAVDGITDSNAGIIIASSSSDNTVRIWERSLEAKEFTCRNVIKTGAYFVLCLNIIAIPHSNVPLLCCGTDTPEVILYEICNTKSTPSPVAKIAGHEDWIRCIDMKVVDNGDLLIATSSQDMMIRISRLSINSNHSLDDSFNLKKDEVHIGGLVYFLSLETVLYGHEGWVYSVNWSPSEVNGAPQLLSASFDRTLVIWKPCPDSGVWLEEARMGELGGDNSLGYYGAKFNPDGSSVLAHSYQGSFHLWRKEDSKWATEYIIGGHSDIVTDISWEKNGRFLVSVSSDKTTRLHAPCIRGTTFINSPWCELSRPQIHGHALHALTTLRTLGFASCSEEKVVRVFLPSLRVLKMLNYFCNSLFTEDEEKSGSTLPSSASLTALGLSNKGNFEGSNADNQVTPFEGDDLDLNPNEDFLVQDTLWPEVMKLYGHGNDVFTLAASHDGKILATASKATTAEQAKIILWETNSWNIINKLEGHQLTVTQMSFSPDDNFLLSVSRDRKWCLFQKSGSDKYEFYSTSQKGKDVHSRIIWACGWTHNGLYFATGSRDCKIIVWDLGKPISSVTSKYGSVTALDFGPDFVKENEYILAVGHESGQILIYSWLQEKWSQIYSVPQDFGHTLTVQRLQFRPILGKTGERKCKKENLQLASCSQDHSVRVYDLCLIH